jgi:NAD(P)-dependent dehydrogenase (short-subunit alcohol dehydrogenase family)
MTAIVTGAARGIGSAIADRLAKEGRNVLRVDLDPSVHGIQADVTKPEDRARIIEAAGTVDVLVNNAGITRDARIVKMTEEDFLGVIRVNLGAAYELTMALTDRFADGASVVSLASRAYLGNFGQFNYSASKGGLVGMTRALALQLAPKVRVNAIAPSLTASEMTLAMPEQVLSKMIASIPMGRMGEPEEIAATVAALASKDMAYVTGQVVVACGGRSLAP